MEALFQATYVAQRNLEAHQGSESAGQVTQDGRDENFNMRKKTRTEKECDENVEEGKSAAKKRKSSQVCLHVLCSKIM